VSMPALMSKSLKTSWRIFSSSTVSSTWSNSSSERPSKSSK
jgi:hypothetical protein